MEIQTNTLIYNHRTLSYMRNHPHFSMKHVHNTYELIFLQSDDAYYVAENKRYRLQNNDLILTRPGTYHYIEIQSNIEYTRYNIAFAPFLLDEVLNLVPNNIDVINCHKNSIICQNFQRMDYYSQHLSEADFQKVLLGLIKEIFYNLSFSSADIVQIPSDLPPVISFALEYINQNLFTLKNVREICEKINLSESYFFKVFNTQLKITPLKYINLKRLQHAQRLLQNGKKPSEIYINCGFESYVGFYKQYIKVFGYPPSQEITQK